ncbi:MAG: metalloregulator ArsR/SmtB family transcription factor [Anaerolineales bacterium]
MSDYHQEITLLKALAHPARLAILEALRGGEACVCHLEALFGWRQAYLSQQLMVLRAAGLAADRREGWNVYYRVIRPEVYAVLDALRQAVPAEAPLDLPTFVSACTCPRCQEKSGRSVKSFHLGEIETTP